VAGKKGLGCDIRKNFAIVFKTWRQRNSLLLKQIAADLGVSANTVNLWEMGRRLDLIAAMTNDRFFFEKTSAIRLRG
jgi:transcriptional regulator with XRE-family HTH domain